MDDITALLTENVMKKLKEEVEKKGRKLSVTEKGKEGNNKMTASCAFLEEELRQFSGLENWSKEVGAN